MFLMLLSAYHFPLHSHSLCPSLSTYFLTIFFYLHLFFISYVLCHAMLCAAGSTRRSSSWRFVPHRLSNLESHTRMVTLRQSVTDTQVMLCLTRSCTHSSSTFSFLALLTLSSPVSRTLLIWADLPWPEPDLSLAEQSSYFWWHERREWVKEGERERKSRDGDRPPSSF